MFCSNFTHKTPTSELWNLIRSFKKRNLGGSTTDPSCFQKHCDLDIDKMCPPTCSPSPEFSLPFMKLRDHLNSNIQHWLGDPLNINELKLALKSVKRQSSPGLDQIDYNIISFLLDSFLEFLVGIFNRILQSGVFPGSWSQSLVIFLPKPNNKSVRPISLTYCVLKTMERCLYNRLRWFTESNFIIPDVQFFSQL